MPTYKDDVSGIPEFAYFAWGTKHRLILVMRFSGLFSARKGTRAITRRLLQHNLNHKITYSKPEEIRGGFEVELTFCPGTQTGQVAKALISPPVSNRGVTKNEQ